MERRKWQRASVRQIDVEGDVARIPLPHGLIALVDAADLPLVEGWNWSASTTRGTTYAYRNRMVDGKQVPIRLHRLLLNPPADMVVDHINRDTLDNRRANLRICTQKANLQNRSNSPPMKYWQPSQRPIPPGLPVLLATRSAGGWTYAVGLGGEVAADYSHWRGIEEPA